MPVIKINEEARRRALDEQRKLRLEAHVLRLSRLSRPMWLALLAVSVLQKPGNTLTRFTAKE